MSKTILLSAWVVVPLFFSSGVLAQSHPNCPDDSYFTVQGDNGVRYGWFEDATCIVPTNSHPECPDESYFTVLGDNGVSYGWYEDATCIVVPASHQECPDESYFTVTGDNGTNYGWYNDQTCVIAELNPDPEPIDPDPIDPEPIDPEPRQEFDSQGYRTSYTLVRKINGEEERLNGVLFYTMCVAENGQYPSYDYSGENDRQTFDGEVLRYYSSSNLFFQNDIPTVIPTELNELGESGESCTLSLSFGLTVSSTYDFNNIPDGVDPADIVRIDPVGAWSGGFTGDCTADFSGFRVESGALSATNLGGNSPGEGGATESCLFLGVDPSFGR